MGSLCTSNSNSNRHPNNETSGPKYDPAVINKNFENYIFENKFIDLLSNKYNLKDPVFKSVQKEERDILEKFYKTKKGEFQSNMTTYLMAQKIDFVNVLTKQIINNEGGRERMRLKIENQIEGIKMDSTLDKFKLKYLTIMLIGQTGVGKSCLINNLLFGGKKVAKEKTGDIGTIDTNPYKSKTVPYLRLVDTRGIELPNAFNVNFVGDNATEFITEQLKSNNVNDMVHCIWYCISSNRMQNLEKQLVDNLISSIDNYKIPVIIVLTQADDVEKIQEMYDYISKKFSDIVDVLAKRKKRFNGTIEPPRGLDKLVDMTIKKCEAGFDGLMKKVSMQKLTEHINKNLSKNNEQIRARITRLMKLETVENDLANQSFDKYINEIYNYNVCYFLDKSGLSSDSNSLIKKCQFNMHKNCFFSNCQQYIKNLLSNELPHFANLFLDIQATKEKEKGAPLQMVNKRNYKDFFYTSEKYLMDNFNYFSSKFYIYFVITNISLSLSENFEQELNYIVEQLMPTNEIQEKIDECFRCKFKDFKEYIKNYPPFIQSGNYYYYDKPEFDKFNNNINTNFDTNDDSDS